MLLDHAFRLLSIRQRTEKELLKKLREKYKTNSSVLEEVINYLKDNNYLDDKDFCKAYIEYRLHTSPQGKYKLIQELIKKGIKKQLACSVVDACDIDEYQYAKPLAARKSANLPKSLTPQKKKERVIRFLFSRGFSKATVKKIFLRLL